MERILINENIINQAHAVSEVKESIELINLQLVPALKSIGEDTLIQDLLLDNLLGNSDETRKRYFIKVQKDVAKIQTPALRKQMENEAIQEFETFEGKVATLKRDVKYPGFIKVENGMAILTETDETRLRETKRVHISDKHEIEAYKLHKKIADDLNALFNGEFPYYTHGNWGAVFFKCDEENGIVASDNINYSWIAERWKKSEEIRGLPREIKEPSAILGLPSEEQYQAVRGLPK